MSTVVDLLSDRARIRPTDEAFLFLDEDEAAASYHELDLAARAVAAALTERGAAGEPVLLVYPPGRAYVEGFLGCLYAGALAVPAYPPDPARLGRTLPRLRALVAHCGARMALSVSTLTGAARALAAEAPELGALEWIATDTIPPVTAGSWEPPRIDATSPALLQYTSGSTGTPRGVLLSHANLLHNAELVRAGFGTAPEAVGVSWLPPYHDMGLIGGILQPIYGGFPIVLMSPLTFLRRPMIWLETISRFHGTMSGGPNFAFDLCVRKSTPEERAALDLSGWTVAFCGAEPVRAETLDRFAAAFAPAGFRREAFYPCYGLAESTLIVTGGHRDAPPRIIPPGSAADGADGTDTRPAGTGHVGCGTALGDQHVAIVDPDRVTRCPPGTVGEIWVSGPSVARGYWKDPVRTARTFGALLADDPGRTYLRTGDLGFLDPTGELVVTGRATDLIIVRGRNVYPQDLEHAVEREVPATRPGCSAAFPVTVDGQERVAIVCEVPAAEVPAVEIIAAIRQALAESCEVSPAAVVLVRPGANPKTSSGKIQRHASRRAYVDGELVAGAPDVVARWDENRLPAPGTGDDAPAPVPAGPDVPDAAPVTFLTVRIANALGLSPAAVPPDQPLTRLGLDSIRAVELQHLLDAEFGLRVPLSELLAGTTVAALAERAGSPTARPLPEAMPSAPDHGPEPAPVTGEFPVSDGQRALWFAQRWAPRSTAYQISRAARIRSVLDVEALERAFRVLVDRHPALRTRLPARGGEPVRQVRAWDGPVVSRYDVAGWDEHTLREAVQADADRLPDLERGPLLRVSLYSRGLADHVLLLSLHHIITDFWSLSVMVDELLARYTAECAGGPPPGSEPVPGPAPTGRTGATIGVATSATTGVATGGPTQPAGTNHGSRLAYWRGMLTGAPPALELPTTLPRPKVQSFRGASHDLRLDGATLRQLDAFADTAGTTRFTTLLAGFAALLARYSGADLVIGVPTAGREDPASAGVLGYFVNPLPVRLTVPPGASFRQLVDTARHTVPGALDHALPFPQLVEELRPVRDPARSPLAQVTMVLHRAPAGRADLAAFAVPDERTRVNLAGLDVSPYRLTDRGSPFDLSLTWAEVDGELAGSVTYCADLFDPPTVTRLAGHLVTLLRRALADPDRPVETLDLLADGERASVLALAGDGNAPDGSTLHALFARQAARRPDADAVVYGRQVLTYAELDDRATRLAGLLRKTYGVRRGGVVGVHAPRGPEAVVAFWAVLRAGAVYLPLAPDLPGGRLAWLIRDAQPVVLLTHSTIEDRLPTAGPPRLRLDADPVEWPAGEQLVGDEVTGPDDLAYIIYTSGTTGRPKGVLVSHRGAVNVAAAEAEALGVTGEDRVLQYASCAYDVSIVEILLAHLRGAALHLVTPDAALPGAGLVRFLAEQRITVAALSPSVLAALPDATLPELSKLIVGGESCPTEVVTRWGPGRRFVNAYGPTETTICATLGACPADGTRPSIGRPIHGVRAYVLDARMEPVPFGVPGELYVGGVGVARGYLGQPGLTADRFPPDPFGTAPGGRLYRTGDRVRWLPDGTLDFLGRFDDQVQIHGIRIEPGEVEVRLRELLGVPEVAVVARPGPGGTAELVAYLVPRGRRWPVAELRGLLRAELPAPWIPAAFVQLDTMPLNSGGKVDRRSLPQPTPADRGQSEPVRPRTELERVVAEVWAAVLGHARVGVRDHFFDELGGTSLAVARVTDELSRRLAREVPVTHLFEHPTVEALARRLAREDVPGGEPSAGPAPEARAEARRQALARRAGAGQRREEGNG